MWDALAAFATVVLFCVALYAQHRIYGQRVREFERREKGFERERADLLNRIMYLSDRPWVPTPADETPEPAPIEELVYPHMMTLPED